MTEEELMKRDVKKVLELMDAGQVDLKDIHTLWAKMLNSIIEAAIDYGDDAYECGNIYTTRLVRRIKYLLPYAGLDADWEVTIPSEKDGKWIIPKEEPIGRKRN